MTNPDFAINPKAAITSRPIGDGISCVIVDDFLKDPHSVVKFAVENAARFEIPPNAYPGHVMDVDPKLTDMLNRYIKTQMSRQFQFLRGDIELVTMLSMTTLRADELSNLQRVCHSDPRPSAGRDNFAGLLYLFEDESLGGTGFYRWRDRTLMEQATALEMKDPRAALKFLKKHFPTYNMPPAYITESNEIAELLAVVPARFNRWVFYSGDNPHSAYIKSPEDLSHDYSKGRLTLNCFATVIPR